MKNFNFRPSILQILYLILFIILFSFIFYTPTLISGPMHLTKKFIIEEETIEGTLLSILFLLSILIMFLYNREVNRHKEMAEKIAGDKKSVEKKLDASYRYIGVINVQIQEIKSIFNAVDKYPESKEDLKKSLHFLGEHVLGIVNVNWVLFRIVNSKTQRTISEHLEIRTGFAFGYPHVSNKMIVENQSISPLTPVVSNPQNLNIIVFCVMPIEKISNEQHIFIQAIINEITKLFIILNSTYYKKENKLFEVEKTKHRLSNV